MVTDVEAGADMLAQGFRCLAYSRDSRIYHDALKQGLDGLREAVSKRGLDGYLLPVEGRRVEV
jgi:hypothetical protein